MREEKSKNQGGEREQIVNQEETGEKKLILKSKEEMTLPKVSAQLGQISLLVNT